jgi:hypothetical protein
VHVFQNPEPLELASADYWRALRDLDLEDFPIVPDFAIHLRESEDAGQHVYFVSKTAGDLASFPYWDNAERDMRHFTAEDVPLGSIDEPVDDADEDWRTPEDEDETGDAMHSGGILQSRSCCASCSWSRGKRGMSAPSRAR